MHRRVISAPLIEVRVRRLAPKSGHRAATRSTLLAAFLLLGCGSGDGGSNTDGGSADAAPLDAFVPGNCDALSKPTGVARKLTHIPASEDFGFDRDGFLIGVSLDNGALVKTAYQPSQPQVIAPNVSPQGFARGTRQLPGGDIVVAVPDRGVVERFAPNGSKTPIAQINDPNGIVVGSDGMVYITAGSGSVSRIDPDLAVTLPLHSAGTSFDGITLSPDEKTLYFNQEMGEILALAIDENGAVGTPQPLTQITVNFLLDGMTADACGNLYIVEMAGMIWKYSETNGLEEWVSMNQLEPRPNLIPAVNFGSGIGGWKNTSLYIMDFNGGVYEIDVGVAGRPTASL